MIQSSFASGGKKNSVESSDFRIGGTKPSVANSTPTPTRVRERAGSVNVGRWPTHSGRRHQKMRKSFAVDRRHLLIFSVYVFIGKKNETESSQTFKLSFNNSLLWNQTFQIWWFLFKSSPCVLLFFPWKLRVGGIQTQITRERAHWERLCANTTTNYIQHFKISSNYWTFNSQQ